MMTSFSGQVILPTVPIFLQPLPPLLLLAQQLPHNCWILREEVCSLLPRLSPFMPKHLVSRSVGDWRQKAVPPQLSASAVPNCPHQPLQHLSSESQE